MPEWKARVQRLPEADKNRDLDQGRQAAAERVGSLSPIKRKLLAGEPFLVVLVFLLDLLEVGL